MRLNIRTRLALLVTLAVALAVALVLYLTWQRVGETTVAMEDKSFASLLLAEEENLNASFMHQLAGKVRSVQNRKQQLRESTLHLLGLMRSYQDDRGEAMNDKMLSRLLGTLNRSSELSAHRFHASPVMLDVVRPDEVLKGGVNRLGLTPDLRDAKQRTLPHLFSRLSAEGDFAVLELPRSLQVAGDVFGITSELERPALAFLLPIDHAPRKHDMPERVIIALTSLEDLENMAAQEAGAMLNMTREKFGNLELYPHGLIALVQSDGTVLASGGDGMLPPAYMQRILDAARATGEAQLNMASPYGELRCHVSAIRAFDAFILITAPLAAIRAPSDALLSRMISISLSIMVLTALAALLLLMHSLKPLALLTRKTRHLAGMDFSSPDVIAQMEEEISQGLPLRRRDELGQLARAFAHMGRALSRNIRELMDTTASKERMEGELSAARDIQVGILPPPDGAQKLCAFPASAFLEPAKEVGGDLYDYFITPDGRRALVLGDVSGKGVPAALFMAMSVTLIRSALSEGLNSAEAMSRVNAMLEEHNPGNMFVTLFLALYDPATGELEYANGGHCLPCIVNSRNNEAPRLLEELSGPMVGVLPDMAYSLHRDRLAEGELCLFYTDGVTEAMNSGGKLYGDERLIAFLDSHRRMTPAELLPSLFRELVAYRGEEPQSDDITMLAFSRPVTKKEGKAEEAE